VIILAKITAEASTYDDLVIFCERIKNNAAKTGNNTCRLFINETVNTPMSYNETKMSFKLFRKENGWNVQKICNKVPQKQR